VHQPTLSSALHCYQVHIGLDAITWTQLDDPVAALGPASFSTKQSEPNQRSSARDSGELLPGHGRETVDWYLTRVPFASPSHP